MNTNQPLLYGLIGLLVGGLLVWLGMVATIGSGNTSMMGMMGMSTDTMTDHHQENDSGMSMDNMVDELQGKSGDEFDAAFIEEMIEHHQGAIDMAEAAKTQAKHDEIKQMADEIISAQEGEITQMQQWQSDWGY